MASVSGFKVTRRLLQPLKSVLVARSRKLPKSWMRAVFAVGCVTCTPASHQALLPRLLGELPTGHSRLIPLGGALWLGRAAYTWGRVRPGNRDPPGW